MSKKSIVGLDERLRDLLKENHMTIKRLSEVTGIPLYSVNNILAAATISGSDAIKIADTLGVTTDFLLKGTSDAKKELLCSHFQCTATPQKSNKSLCCFRCPDRHDCATRCLNNPDKCGLVKE